MNSSKIYSFVLVSFLLAPFISFAGTKELETQVAELQRINEAQSKNLATALNQLQDVLAEFQKLNGRVEASEHLVTDQQNIIKDSQRRLEILEDKSQLLVTQLEDLKKAGLLPAAQAKSLSDFKAFQQGITQLNGDDYKGAAVTLQAFVKTNPKSPYAENAQYWIGECYYGMRDFPRAVAEFQKVIKDFPKGSKIAASMLKQGFSFFEMQSFDDAKAFLEKVIVKYPQTDEAIKAQVTITQINRLLEAKQKEALENKTT